MDTFNRETAILTNSPSITTNCWEIQRRQDGALLVRVPSAARDGPQLPDAVFTFCLGDPQYSYWEQQWRERERTQGETACGMAATDDKIHMTKE
jgi:hypothetical protein